MLRTIPTKWYGVMGLVITKDGILAASGLPVAGIEDEQNLRGTAEGWELATGKLVKSSPVFDVVGPVSADGQCTVHAADYASGCDGPQTQCSCRAAARDILEFSSDSDHQAVP
jgi:hypothetical protein